MDAETVRVYCACCGGVEIHADAYFCGECRDHTLTPGPNLPVWDCDYRAQFGAACPLTEKIPNA